MNVSSRTPEGVPNHCPLCRAEICIEPAEPTGDAPCPRCGSLLWFVAWDAQRFWYERGALPAELRGRLETLMAKWEPGADSLDRIEFIMELEDALNLSIPDRIAERFSSPDDLIRWLIQRQ